MNIEFEEDLMGVRLWFRLNIRERSGMIDVRDEVRYITIAIRGEVRHVTIDVRDEIRHG